MTAQHSTAQHSTAQHSTQHNTQNTSHVRLDNRSAAFCNIEFESNALTDTNVGVQPEAKQQTTQQKGMVFTVSLTDKRKKQKTKTNHTTKTLTRESDHWQDSTT